MNKPKIYNGDAYYYFKKLKEENKYISLPFGVSGVPNTERQREIGSMFPYYMRDNVEVEDVIYDLNQMCDHENVKIQMPYSEGDIDFAIIFDNGAAVHINTVDEYYGGGNCEIAITVEGIANVEELSDEEIKEMIEWLEVAFDKGL